MNIAVIPARGGSKRIPRKNIRLFQGLPIIAHSIETAKQSGLFDRIIVSTDDSEIAELSRYYGAETPFVRPSELSDDHAATLPVVKHTLNWLIDNEKATIKAACCIYATAPLMQIQHLKACKALLLSEENVDYSFPICPFPFPVQRAVGLTNNGRIEALNPKNMAMRSQDFKPAFHDAGQFYWGRPTAFIEEKPFFTAQTLPLIIHRKFVVDIDTLEDWEMAELRATSLAKNTDKG